MKKVIGVSFFFLRYFFFFFVILVLSFTCKNIALIAFSFLLREFSLDAVAVQFFFSMVFQLTRK